MSCKTLCKVFQHLKKFKGESKLFSWMYRIATNEAISFINQKPEKGISSESLQNKLLTTSNLTLILMEMKFKLNYIKPSQHFQKTTISFKMKYFEELKYEQIWKY
jgi:RNA polymerase sigma-70 factor (ECF subfamily)